MEGPGGRVVGITRVKDATFDLLHSVLKASLPTCGGPVFPDGSVILIWALVELLRLNVRYNDFDKWLADISTLARETSAPQNTRSSPFSPLSIMRT